MAEKWAKRVKSDMIMKSRVARGHGEHAGLLAKYNGQVLFEKKQAAPSQVWFGAHELPNCLRREVTIAQLGERTTEDRKVPCSIHGGDIFVAAKFGRILLPWEWRK